MTLTGVVKNFGGLLATRFLLGVFEYVDRYKAKLSAELTKT